MSLVTFGSYYYNSGLPVPKTSAICCRSTAILFILLFLFLELESNRSTAHKNINLLSSGSFSMHFTQVKTLKQRQMTQSGHRVTSQSDTPCGQLWLLHQDLAQQDLQCTFSEGEVALEKQPKVLQTTWHCINNDF